LISSAIILAGGMGTRLRNAVPDLPKPMAPINGRPFLEHQIDYWIEQGIERFILSVGYKKEIIIDHFGCLYRNAVIEFVEEDTPKGTGGGLLLAAQNESRPFFVLNGDTFFQVDLAEIVKFHLKNNSDWTFGLFRSNEGGRYMGVDLLQDGRIASLRSGTREMGCLANGGVYLVNPSIFQNSNFSAGDTCSLEDDLVPQFLASGRNIYGVEIGGVFIDIGVPEDYYRATSVMIQ